MKRLVVLGSTGSVGTQTLDVVRRFPDRLRVVGLAARRIEAVAAQAREFAVRYVSLGDQLIEDGAFHTSVSVLSGASQLETIATLPEADLIVVATAGRAGLLATIAALRAGKSVALANKEVLVMAGHLVNDLIRTHGGQIIPVDSEHGALWQCLLGENRANIVELMLTASGGALRDVPQEALQRVTPAEALHHPTWTMGSKITIDSATLMNKGLEVIEAHWLFDCPYSRIRVVMHATSVVHALVQFVDGSVKAHLGRTDMRLPIQYALSFPERWECEDLQIDITRIGRLDFAEPDWSRYPCLRLAIDAGKQGGTYPAALCGADEVAIELFMQGIIPFTAIAALVERVLDEHVSQTNPSVEQILCSDDLARKRCRELAQGEVWP